MWGLKSSILGFSKLREGFTERDLYRCLLVQTNKLNDKLLDTRRLSASTSQKHTYKCKIKNGGGSVSCQAQVLILYTQSGQSLAACQSRISHNMVSINSDWLHGIIAFTRHLPVWACVQKIIVYPLPAWINKE